jgi:LAO/AO transport system kinase
MSVLKNLFLNKIAAKIVKREEDPYTAVERLSNILVHSYTQGGVKNDRKD